MIQLTLRVAREHAERRAGRAGGARPRRLRGAPGGDAIEFVLYGAAGRAARRGRRPRGGRRAPDRRLDHASCPTTGARTGARFHKPCSDVRGPLRVRPPGSRRCPARSTSSSTPARRSAPVRTPPRGSRLELLATLEPEGALADWGCGSGVLAIAAAKLGWAPVLACDVEPESVAATREGAAANGVTIEVTRCDVRQGGPPAPTVLANLVRPLLLEVAAGMTDVPRPPDHLGPRGRRARRGRPRLRAPRPGRDPPPRGRELVGDRAHRLAPVITLDDVQAAAGRLAGVAHRTPVLTGRLLDEATGRARVLLKAENLQRAGAFKFRGAYNAVASLSREERARGVATVSSGNHAGRAGAGRAAARGPGRDPDARRRPRGQARRHRRLRRRDHPLRPLRAPTARSCWRRSSPSAGSPRSTPTTTSA